jgi:hypothetical protein
MICEGVGDSRLEGAMEKGCQLGNRLQDMDCPTQLDYPGLQIPENIVLPTSIKQSLLCSWHFS